jgi:glycine betaine/proline transport system permease protein
MDITPSIKAIPVGNGILEALRRRAIPVVGAIVLAVMLWDLANHREGPTIQVFFPRLYMWLFGAFAVALVWGTLKAIRAPIWRLAVAGVLLAMAVLAVVGTPDSFPFYAPGQDLHVIEGQRVRQVDDLKFNVIGTEVRPGGLDNRLQDIVLWMKDNWKAFFRGLTNNLLKIMVPMNQALLEMPMWLFIVITALAAWRVSGYKVAIGTIAGLGFLAVFDLWTASMLTMTVIGTATILSIATAIPMGIAMAKSDALEGVMRPVLDTMQTMPSFVYLIPAIFFLGIGIVPAVMATLIYAVPPAIRLTNLGIRLVSPELVEAARAFGTTPTQLLIKIQLPLARPTIMAGVNQTIMMALAMVVVAALVGAGGLGGEVYAGISQLEFGRGFMGGFGIVVLAVIIDRIVQGMAKDPRMQRDS